MSFMAPFEVAFALVLQNIDEGNAIHVELRSLVIRLQVLDARATELGNSIREICEQAEPSDADLAEAEQLLAERDTVSREVRAVQHRAQALLRATGLATTSRQ